MSDRTTRVIRNSKDNSIYRLQPTSDNEVYQLVFNPSPAPLLASNDEDFPLSLTDSVTLVGYNPNVLDVEPLFYVDDEPNEDNLFMWVFEFTYDGNSIDVGPLFSGNDESPVPFFN